LRVAQRNAVHEPWNRQGDCLVRIERTQSELMEIGAVTRKSIATPRELMAEIDAAMARW
jgi:hypothetical protein